jgi:hypothetical protein
MKIRMIKMEAQKPKIDKNDNIELKELLISGDNGFKKRIMKNKVLAKVVVWIEAMTKIHPDGENFSWQVGKTTKPYFKNWTSDYLRKILSELESWELVEKDVSSGNLTVWKIKKDGSGKPIYKKYLSYAKMSYRNGKW